MFKPPGKVTGRIKFYGTTPLGIKVSGNDFRIIKHSLKIKSGEKWITVNQIHLSKVTEAAKNV